jgi:hypothetical protein
VFNGAGFVKTGGLSTQYLMADGSTTTGGGGGGDVSSSISSSVSNAIPLYDGTTGKLIKSSGVLCDSSNNLTQINQ